MLLVRGSHFRHFPISRNISVCTNTTACFCVRVPREKAVTPLFPAPRPRVCLLAEEGGEQVEEVFTAGGGQSKLGVLRAAGLPWWLRW